MFCIKSRFKDKMLPQRVKFGKATKITNPEPYSKLKDVFHCKKYILAD